MRNSKQQVVEEATTPAEDIFVQFGLPENEGKLYKVVKPFMLSTRYGPTVAVSKGSLVRLDAKMGPEAFLSGQVEPVDLGDTFTVIKNFQAVNADGCWILVGPGDVVKLGRTEAIKYMRQGLIREGEIK